jgi:hypothetical protein
VGFPLKFVPIELISRLARCTCTLCCMVSYAAAIPAVHYEHRFRPSFDRLVIVTRIPKRRKLTVPQATGPRQSASLPQQQQSLWLQARLASSGGRLRLLQRERC